MSGPTLSASEFADVTGMTRDRLRTWERRHGWPEPVRSDGGARRYATDDAARVVAVRRLHESGVPLDRAIEQHANAALRSLAASTWRALVDELPMPVVLLSGPIPLTVVHANAMLRERADGPRTGDIVEDVAPWFVADDGYDRMRTLFTGRERVAVSTHPDWSAGMQQPARSMAIRVPQRPGTLPLVALVGIETSANRRAQSDVGLHRRERDRLADRTTRIEQWAATTAEITRISDQDTIRALRMAMHALRKATGVADAAAFMLLDGAPVLLTCLRGRFSPPREVAPELLSACDDDTPAWVEPTIASTLGAPATCGVTVTAVPARGDAPAAFIALAGIRPLDVGHAETSLFEACAAQVARMAGAVAAGA